MKFLPDCLLRSSTERADVYYCRHTKVHTADNFVSPEICQRCVWHNTPCDYPRPESYASRNEIEPSLVARAIGVGSALVAFVGDGMQLISEAQFANRLSICVNCDEHQGNWCRRCGCNLSLKARGRVFECPLGKWPKIES